MRKTSMGWFQWPLIWKLLLICSHDDRGKNDNQRQIGRLNAEGFQLQFQEAFLASFNWAPRHEGILGEWIYSSTHSLTSALDGGECSASRPGRINPSERARGTHCRGGWVGPRAVLDAVVKRKIPSPPPGIEP
jgi:hypothetical protein